MPLDANTPQCVATPEPAVGDLGCRGIARLDGPSHQPTHKPKPGPTQPAAQRGYQTYLPLHTIHAAIALLPTLVHARRRPAVHHATCSWPMTARPLAPHPRNPRHRHQCSSSGKSQYANARRCRGRTGRSGVGRYPTAERGPMGIRRRCGASRGAAGRAARGGARNQRGECRGRHPLPRTTPRSRLPIRCTCRASGLLMPKLHQKPYRPPPPPRPTNETGARLWDIIYAVPPRPANGGSDARIWDVLHKWPKTNHEMAAFHNYWRIVMEHERNRHKEWEDARRSAHLKDGA